MEQVDTRNAPGAPPGTIGLGEAARLYEAVGEAVFLLDGQGRIVFANRGALDLLGVAGQQSLLGRTHAEAFECRHATAEEAEECGLCSAVRGAARGQAAVRECCVDRGGRRDALELEVRAAPLELDGGPHVVLAALDLRHARGRRALERVFFHDIVNTAQGLKMLVEIFALAGPDRREELVAALKDGLERLLEEVRQQKDLAAAERNDLRLRISPVDSLGLLEELRDTWLSRGMDQRRIIGVDPACERVTLHGDRTLLARVLGGMVGNAVEASAVGERITLGCLRREGEVEFWVHHPRPMPEEVQRQVFRRSFSPRGTGRGMGTYDMCLLSERYLNGRVGFTSTPSDGTRFYARYPLAGPA